MKSATKTTRQCGSPSCPVAATLQCASCGAMGYCSPEHQRSHWKAHKVECRSGKLAKGGLSVGGAAGRGDATAAPEGKEGKEEGDSGAVGRGPAVKGKEGSGGDVGEQTDTQARYDMLGSLMQQEGFDIHTTPLVTPCGRNRRCALDFALGEEGDPHDEAAVKRVLGAPGVDVNSANGVGQTLLLVQCYYGRNRNVELRNP